jgi:hypothetical protein
VSDGSFNWTRGGKRVKKVVTILGVVILLAAVVAGAFAVGQPASAAPKNAPPVGSPSLEDRLQALETQVSELAEELAAAEATIDDLTADLAAIDVTGLGDRLADVEANKALALDPYLEVTTETLNGLLGPNILFTGANLHLRNGHVDQATSTINGLGNLIIGYNEGYSDRSGSHNLVVGPFNRWTSYGGFVAGRENAVTAPHASVSGGYSNRATNSYSSVSGGAMNTASALYSSVSGGSVNHAAGSSSSVSGGSRNAAWGSSSSVSGGYERSATGTNLWRAGDLWQSN